MMDKSNNKSTASTGSPPSISPGSSPVGSKSPVTSVGAVTTPLDPATRPSLNESSTALSQLSVTAQPAQTPQSRLSTSTPTTTPVPNVATGPIDSGVTPPQSTSPDAFAVTQSGIASEWADTPEVNPAVALLKSMFPDFDDVVLQSVLDACDDDQDRAVEMLLGMSDPDFVPSADPPPSRQPTQLELDEELARRLFLEDQEASRPPPASPQRHHRNVPYQPRQSHTNQSHHQSSGGRDGGYGHQQSGENQGLGIATAASELRERFGNFISGATQPAPRSVARTDPYNTSGAHQGGPGGPGAGSDFQEQFNKFAETGKRTFNSIVTKVKAKIQELENPHSPDGQQGQQQAGHWSNWQYDPHQSPQDYHGPGQSQQAQADSFTFREEPAFPNDPSKPGAQRSTSPPTQGGPRTGSNVGYYVPQPNTTSGAAPATAVATSPRDLAPNPNAQKPVPVVPPTESGATESTTPRASFDASRLGLKPKRPVSFVDTNTAHTQQGKQRDHDEESLEYTSSPFDDR